MRRKRKRRAGKRGSRCAVGGLLLLGPWSGYAGVIHSTAGPDTCPEDEEDGGKRGRRAGKGGSRCAVGALPFLGPMGAQYLFGPHSSKNENNIVSTRSDRGRGQKGPFCGPREAEIVDREIFAFRVSCPIFGGFVCRGLVFL